MLINVSHTNLEVEVCTFTMLFVFMSWKLFMVRESTSGPRLGAKVIAQTLLDHGGAVGAMYKPKGEL